MSMADLIETLQKKGAIKPEGIWTNLADLGKSYQYLAEREPTNTLIGKKANYLKNSAKEVEDYYKKLHSEYVENANADWKNVPSDVINQLIFKKVKDLADAKKEEAEDIYNEKVTDYISSKDRPSRIVNQIIDQANEGKKEENKELAAPNKKGGRPRKKQIPIEVKPIVTEPIKRKRGRPKKTTLKLQQDKPYKPPEVTIKLPPEKPRVLGTKADKKAREEAIKLLSRTKK